MALVKLSADGQELSLPDSIANDDAQLKAALTPFYPEMANATIRRETLGGEIIVTMTKQAGTKGAERTGAGAGAGELRPVGLYLEDAPQELNPALRVAWRIQYMQALDRLELEDLIELQPKIEAAYQEGQHAATFINRVAETLKNCPARPASKLTNMPAGF